VGSRTLRVGTDFAHIVLACYAYMRARSLRDKKDYNSFTTEFFMDPSVGAARTRTHACTHARGAPKSCVRVVPACVAVLE
jgi:hypothetical protein